MDEHTMRERRRAPYQYTGPFHPTGASGEYLAPWGEVVYCASVRVEICGCSRCAHGTMEHMQLSATQRAVLVFTLAYTLGFGAFFVMQGNKEFLWYVAVLVFFLVLVIATIRTTRFTPPILWGLSLWGLLHMAGGGVPVGDDVLYGLQLIDIIQNGELTILKYDQVVHAFGFAVATLVAHHLLVPYWRAGASRTLLYIAAAFVGMGLGALNEIVEFIAVLTFPETGVGGYFNTALDLVANACGAVAAAFFLAWRERRRDT